MKQWWFGLWISLAYALRLRGLFNSLQRRLKGEHNLPRAELFKAKTPQEIRDFATSNGYTWRPDETRIGGWRMPLDWVTHPKVFQAKLESDGYPEGEGDCDDYHNWFAACLRLVPGVSRVLVVSSGYPGGGHCTCAYELDGQKYWVNYRIQEIDDFNDIPQLTADWANERKGEGNDVTFYVFERAYPKWEAVAIGPKGKVEE